MERENTVEQLKVTLRQHQADVKLARLENEAIIRQCEYERSNNKHGGGAGEQRDFRMGLQTVKSPSVDARRMPPKSPGVDRQANNASVPRNHDGSYLDMSYSQSPSIN